MLKLLQCEYIKLKRSKILLIGTWGTMIVPFFVISKTVTEHLLYTKTGISLFSLYESTLMFLMLLSAPIILTISGSWMISREYTDGTLKNILTVPVSKTAFLAGKLLVFAIFTFVFMMISWLEILVSALICSLFIQVTELTLLSSLFFLMKMLMGGILLCATQTPFLFLAIKTKGSAAPLTAVSAVSLVNVVLSNSGIAGFFPWSASYLLVFGRSSGAGCSGEISILVILILCLLGIIACILQLKSEE